MKILMIPWMMCTVPDCLSLYQMAQLFINSCLVIQEELYNKFITEVSCIRTKEGMWWIGTLKCNEIPFHSLLLMAILTTISFRLDRGHAVGLTIATRRLEAPDLRHYSKNIIFARHTSIILPKGSPLVVWKLKMVWYITISLKNFLAQALFQNATMWLRDTGILNKLRYDVLNPPIPIPDPTMRHNQPLIIYQLGIIMIIFLIGIMISIFALITELLKFRKMKRVGQRKSSLGLQVEVLELEEI